MARKVDPPIRTARRSILRSGDDRLTRTGRPPGAVRPHGLRVSLPAATIALLCLPALAQATEPTWLVGTSTGVSAAGAVHGERIAPGIRVVRGGRLRGAPAAGASRACASWSPTSASGRAASQRRATRSSASSGRSAATRARAAWAATLGDGVPVAVLDSGIDLSNPDLAANVWTNPDEVRRTASTTTPTASSTTCTAPTPSAGTATRATASGTARPWQASSRRAATTGSASAAWRGTRA